MLRNHNIAKNDDEDAELLTVSFKKEFLDLTLIYMGYFDYLFYMGGGGGGKKAPPV